MSRGMVDNGSPSVVGASTPPTRQGATDNDGETDGDPSHSNTAQEKPYSVFSARQRQILTGLLGLASLASPLTANIYLPLLPLLQEQYHASAQAINLTITLYVVIQAVMPLFFAPTADQHGRRLVSLFTLLIYTIGSLGLTLNDAIARSYPALLILRALQALGASACATTIYGVVSDVCIPAERGAMVGPVIGISNVGTVLGPTLGGVIAWKTGSATWVFAAMALFSAATFSMITACWPETARKVVGDGAEGKRLQLAGFKGWFVLGPRWAHQATGHEMPMQEKAPNPTNSTNLANSDATTGTHSQKQPFKWPNPLSSLTIILSKDTALILWLGSCSYAEWYTINAAWPQIFKAAYGWNELTIGLAYLPSAVAIILAGFAAGPWTNARYRRTAREAGLPADGHRVDGFPIERARLRGLWPVFAGTHLGVAGLGWAARYGAHPAVVLVLTAATGFLKSLLFSSLNTLLVDVHADRPSTASAAGSLVRSGLSGVGLAVLQPLADALGWGWFFTALALLVGATQGAGMVVLGRWGQGWREERVRREAR
ncbi:major facilitator superfamily domain-containing protein [Xylariomycetidae sp. FL2044]|nr:major facilitator superfamily domain-containing protein [Xylariomycetidae sp. FL2044]